ncbi:MAG: beta-lactamase family protein [Ferruginibacter sp.]|nr:beta-lactamase family protein [Ferruginibacter sp.]
MKQILVLLLFIFLLQNSIAQSANTTAKYGTVTIKNADISSAEMKAITHQLDSFYQKRIAAGFSGQVLIGYKGNVIYERYFGYADKESERLIDANSPSQLASTSKPITAIAIAILKDRGLLNFDDFVQKYIPAFPYTGITIRHLLTHRSGLPEYFGMAMSKPLPQGDSLMSNDSLVQLLIDKKPKLVNPPNTKFRYRNTNYALLSYIISVVSKMSYAEFVQKNIFDVLEMKDSYVLDNTCAHKANCCKSYKRNWLQQKDTQLDGITGDKGCYSTVQDLYKLDQALYQHTLITPTTLEEMYLSYSFERKGYQNYGLGWRMFNYPQQKIIFHNGYWQGNNNCFYRFINDNFTIIILGNKLNKYIYAHPQVIYKIITNNQLQVEEEVVE